MIKLEKDNIPYMTHRTCSGGLFGEKQTEMLCILGYLMKVLTVSWSV